MKGFTLFELLTTLFIGGVFMFILASSVVKVYRCWDRGNPITQCVFPE